jgi:hypothetical protein
MAIQSGIYNGKHVSVPAVLKCRIIRFVSLTRSGLGSYSRKEAVFRILPHCSSLNDVISVGSWKHGLSWSLRMLKRSWTIFTVYFFIFLNPTTSSWFVSVLIICTFLFIPYILESRGGFWWQNALQAYKLTAFMVDENWGDGNQRVRVGLWSDPPWLILAVVSIFTNDAALYSRRCLLSVIGLCEIFASASLYFCLSKFGTSISLNLVVFVGPLSLSIWWSLFCFWSSPKSSCFSLAALLR